TEVDKRKMSYERKVDNVDIPWDITLTNRLDRQKIKPKELIGKDGKVEIDIDVQQNKKANKEFFENYLLQIEVSFDADTTEDIEADDAVIANAGKDELVTFTSMPEE